MTQPALFDADRTTPQACAVPGCTAIRQPDEDKTPACNVDLLRAAGDWITRPAGCLNTINPAHTQIPY